MATHLYYNPGARKTKSRTSIDGVVGIPVTTDVEIHDGADHLQLSFTDLDALSEVCELLIQARAEHVTAMCDGHSEMVLGAHLDPEDLVVIDGELVSVCFTVLENRHVIVNYSKKYAGMYEMAGVHSVRILRSERVKRLNVAAALAVVS